MSLFKCLIKSSMLVVAYHFICCKQYVPQSTQPGGYLI